MIRQARPTDYPFVFPILDQIFDEMDMATIKRLPVDQFYDLMKHGFYSDHYRYSYHRIWVAVDKNDRPLGLITMYSDDDQRIIDGVLRDVMPKVGLPRNTEIFTDQEALPNEWYVDALAVAPSHWGEGIATQLLDFADQVARNRGYHQISLNVDQENPRAQRLYEYRDYRTVSTMTIGDRSYDHMIKKI